MLELFRDQVLTLAPLLAYILGGALLSVCFYTFYWLKRREFHRRNHLGVQAFNSYAHMIFTRNLEFLIRLLAFVGIFLGGAVIGITIIYA